MRRVRLLELADVPAACDLAASAGWNQTLDDWERMIKLEPSGCFGIEEEARSRDHDAAHLWHGFGVGWDGADSP